MTSAVKIKFENFDSICRLCLKHELFLKPIFLDEDCKEYSFESNDDNENIAEVIEKCTRIEISQMDSLPKYACSECLEQLLKCNYFRRQCIKSDEILKSIVEHYRNKEISNSEEKCASPEPKSASGTFFKLEIDMNGIIEEIIETTDQSYSIEPTLVVINNEKDDSELESDVKNKISERRKRSYVKRAKGQTSQRKKSMLRQCQFCGKMSERIEMHMLTHTGEKNYKCTLCPKSFGHKGNLNRHLNLHLNRREYQCDLCDKAFNEQRSLEIHYVRHTGERNFTCEICNETFKYLQSLRRHKRSHSQDRRYECSTCHKTFYTKYCLTKHNRSHTGERPYKCEYCGKCFKSSPNLCRHRRTHTKVGAFKCTFCEDVFVHKKDLSQHLENHKIDQETEEKSN